MARTLSNAERTVCTQGSDDVAVAVAPDVCLVAGKPKPFPNHVGTAALDAGKTETVRIAGEPVWTSAGKLGPPSEPPHPGTLGVVSGKPAHGPAEPTSWSSDVFAEAMPVVRVFDSTLQNDGNTQGIVLPAELFAELGAEGVLALRARFKNHPTWPKHLPPSARPCQWITNYTGLVTPPSGAFNASRAPFSLGPVQPYGRLRLFSGDAYQQQTMTIRNHTFDVISPMTYPAATPGARLPSVGEVGSALSALPDELLSRIDRVTLESSSYELDWLLQLTRGGSAAGLATSGGIRLFPGQATTQDEIDALINHEAGHLLEMDLWDHFDLDSDRNQWLAAMTNDRQSPSDYANTSMHEDFAESVLLYRAVRGTPCEGIARGFFPNRFALLDGYFKAGP